MFSSIKDMVASRWSLLARIASVLVVPISLSTFSKWLLDKTGMSGWWLILLGITLVLLVLEIWTFVDIAKLKSQFLSADGSDSDPATGRRRVIIKKLGFDQRELLAMLLDNGSTQWGMEEDFGPCKSLVQLGIMEEIPNTRNPRMARIREDYRDILLVEWQDLLGLDPDGIAISGRRVSVIPPDV